MVVPLLAALFLSAGEARAQIDTDLEEEDVDVEEIQAPEVAEDVEVESEVDVGVDEATPEGSEPADPVGDAPTPAPVSEPLVADAEDAEEDPAVREERRAIAHQTAIEQTEPRPPEQDVPVPDGPAWMRRIEVGADAAFVMRPFHNGKVDSPISYEHAVAWGLHAHWSVLPWLRLTPYFLDVHHGLDIPQGALAAPPRPRSIDPSWVVSDATVTTFVFGLKIQPTYEFTDRLRAWATFGVGWGRFRYPEMNVSTDRRYDPNDPPEEGEEGFEDIFVIRDRASVFVELPIGLGVSFDIIDRWLAIEFESIAAPITGQSGTAHEIFQAVDAEGNTRDVGPFGAVQASFVQALGLSLIL